MSLRLLVIAALLLAPGALLARDGGTLSTPPSEAAAMASHDPFPPKALRAATGAGCTGLLNQQIEDLKGRMVNLCAFQGKVLLIVNTASQCGYTPQYKGLQVLHERYAAKGLVVMGFPSNDFGQQEPGSNADIGEFCELNYGVSFPMFSKVTVKGAAKVPFFAALTTVPTVAPGEIRWNFEKFLIGRDGTLLARFPSSVEPESPALTAPLEKALGG